MKLAAACLLALSASAQDLPLVRGTVAEFGTTPPNTVAGAEIILYEFATVDGAYGRQPIATAYSDGRGAFSIKPDHPGSYFIEAKKPTYLTAEELDNFTPIPCCSLAEQALTIERGAQLEEIRFILIRPGALRGRVIDEQDQPVDKLSVTAIGVGRRITTATDADGVFTFPAILPGAAILRVGPDGSFLSPRFQFTKDDLETVEQDIETTYWPGGVADAKLALPIHVIPGATMNAPTIRVRKGPYYRAHLSLPDCERGRSMGLPLGVMFMVCSKELLLEKLTPGSRVFATWNQGEKPTDIAAWALVPLTITDHNIDVTVSMTPSVDVSGKFVAKNADRLPEIGTTRVTLRPVEISFLSRVFETTAAKDGSFVIAGVAWPRHQVSVILGNPNLVVKEIRYGGQLAPDGIVSILPGSVLEVVLDAR